MLLSVSLYNEFKIFMKGYLSTDFSMKLNRKFIKKNSLAN